MFISLLKRTIFILTIITVITLPVAQSGYDPLEDSVATVFFKVVKVADNDVLNIRRLPSSSSEKIGQIASNESCLVYMKRRDDSKNWVKVSYKGVTGWTSLNYLQINDSPTCWRYYRVTKVKTGEHLNLRKSPGSHNHKVGKIPHHGECLLRLDDAVASKARWYMFEYRGVKGWAHTGYLRRMSVDDCDV